MAQDPVPLDEGGAAAALPDPAAQVGETAAAPAPAPAPASEAVEATAAALAEKPATAAPAAGSDEPAAQEDDDFHHPGIAIAVALLFVVAAVAKMQLFQVEGEMLGRVDKLASGALMIVTAVWFILCFTGDAKRRVNDIFVFAYAFTLGSFAMLVLPFVSEQQAQADMARSATLSLVRGCVRKDAAGGLSEVSAVVLCPYELDKLKDWPNAPKDDAASGAARMAPHKGELRYTLLLAIGGVTATVRDDPQPTAKVANDKTHQHVEVVGGLAVPFFVLVMAFIGGAVSLSRRIPEYQRRLHPDYKANADEGKMLPFEVRESVVFQIMQLVSAPFLAVATWYIVTPTGLSSAATLAFGTGFASEPLLLMIRGVVKGIRPEGARPKPSAAPEPAAAPVAEPPPPPPPPAQ